LTKALDNRHMNQGERMKIVKILNCLTKLEMLLMTHFGCVLEQYG